VISDAITPSACDIMIALRGIPMLEPERPNRRWRELENVLIKDCGTSIQNVRCAYIERFRLQDAFRPIAETNHQSWPVMSEPGSYRLLGLLSRKSLERTLREMNLFSESSDTLDQQTADTLVDIRHVIDEQPHVLWKDTSFIDAYKVFRMLQLRTLCIIDEGYSLVCLITRNDLAEVIEERTNTPIMEMRDHCENCNHMNTKDDLGDDGFEEMVGRVLSFMSARNFSQEGSVGASDITESEADTSRSCSASAVLRPRPFPQLELRPARRAHRRRTLEMRSAESSFIDEPGGRFRSQSIASVASIPPRPYSSKASTSGTYNSRESAQSFRT